MVMMSVASDWRHGRIESIKGESTLAVVIPARDEEGTIGQVVSAIAAELGEAVRGDMHYHTLFLIGVVLFVFAFIINLTADLIVKGIKVQGNE